MGVQGLNTLVFVYIILKILLLNHKQLRQDFKLVYGTALLIISMYGISLNNPARQTFNVKEEFL